MKTKLFILILLGLLLFTALGAGASGPLKVDVHVDETRVREGEMVQVIWTVSGGTPEYTSWITWDAIWTNDTLIGNSGNQYHSLFRVRPGMLPLIGFKIGTYDEQAYRDNPLVVHSSSLGNDIINLDGWTSPGSTRIELDRRQLRTGETVTAKVYRVFDVSIAGYHGFQYQWGITDANGRTTYTDVKRVSSDQYDTVLSYFPQHGASGHLRVIADETKITDDDTTKDYYSDTFTILEGARQGIPQIQTPVPPVTASTRTPASLNQRMATRSGPGTQYTEELGTLSQDTGITLIETVTIGKTPWGMVEFSRNGLKYRAYTGMKRINASGPVTQGILDYYEVNLSQATAVYYGPGFDYAQRKGSVPAGTQLQVYGTENDFFLCDYKSGGEWVRAYFPAL